MDCLRSRQDWSSRPVPKGSEGAAQLVQMFDLQEIVNYMTKTLPRIKHRVVFCHNDMNRANCLLKEEGKDVDEKVVLVDYEFCCYNYRGCDLGSHFQNRMMDVTKLAEQQMKEGGMSSGLTYPSEPERRFFVRAYLAEITRIGAFPFDPETDTEDNLLLEAEFFGLVYQVFFLSWIIKDSDKLKSSGFKVEESSFFNIFLFFAGMIKNIMDRRAAVDQLRDVEWRIAVLLSNKDERRLIWWIFILLKCDQRFFCICCWSVSIKSVKKRSHEEQ